MFENRQWSPARVAIVLFLSAVLIFLSTRIPQVASNFGVEESVPFLGVAQGESPDNPAIHPLFEFLKLVAAGFVGISINYVTKRSKREKPLPRSVQHAQILLCVASAMLMIIIGNSVARALGIAGGASIVRFRTPVEDPKDAVVFIMLLGLGMACGVGAFAVAGLGTIFLCIFLLLLDEMGEEGRSRQMMLELVSASSEFPTEHVQHIFAAYQVQVEPREVTEGKEAVHKYWCTLPPDTSLEYLSDHLLAGGAAGIKAVSWGAKKKS